MGAKSGGKDQKKTGAPGREATHTHLSGCWRVPVCTGAGQAHPFPSPRLKKFPGGVCQDPEPSRVRENFPDEIFGKGGAQAPDRSAFTHGRAGVCPWVRVNLA